jgi:hypothetical protein
MIKPKTLDDFKGREIPYYYKAAKKKDIPFHIQNQMILNHFKTHLRYKFLAVFASIYSFYYFFKYLKYSRFLEISQVNFKNEKKENIKRLLFENEV